MSRKCPRCGGGRVRVIYMGFPMWFCGASHELALEGREPECITLWGFWSYILAVVPFNGVMFYYDYKRYSYPRALLVWLLSPLPNE